MTESLVQVTGDKPVLQMLKSGKTTVLDKLQSDTSPRDSMGIQVMSGMKKQACQPNTYTERKMNNPPYNENSCMGFHSCIPLLTEIF